MISAKKLSKSVSLQEAHFTILQPTDLDIPAGSSCAVVGPSGSGKSTLLALLAGLDSPTSGTVTLSGVNITNLNEEAKARFRRDHIGFIFQNFQLMPTLTALENVALPLQLQGRRDAQAVAKQWLAKTGLSHREQHLPALLSGGEQQRVAVARAFASEPAILFADEPTGSLDGHNGEQVLALMFDLNADKQTTILLVTHDQRVADRCDRQIALVDGRLQ
ncbi:MAG: ABC transporter [Gammaproteobacteria bacterium]|nr:MAG: ABC transporter [Gammaproteobacteria bacterium]RLA13438.1 MAG: ABC transporter [Gammaproteobacteria bacterium]RLA15625.1 MAG: ABC transporter [Gammaproteobacteria bacterium]